MVASRRFGWLWRQVRGAPPAPVVKPYDIPRAAE